jgi:hypothetical protein
MLTIKCLSKNDKIYYTYPADVCQKIAKEFYKNGGKIKKNRAIFLKDLGRYMPRAKSFRDYKITDEEFKESLEKSLVNVGPESAAAIRLHYERMNRVRTGEIRAKCAFKF